MNISVAIAVLSIKNRQFESTYIENCILWKIFNQEKALVSRNMIELKNNQTKSHNEGSNTLVLFLKVGFELEHIPITCSLH